MTKTTDNQAIRALYAQIDRAWGANTIIHGALRRSVGGVELAKLIRGVLREHGLKGIRVKTSSCGVVDVTLPALAYSKEEANKVFRATGVDMTERTETIRAERDMKRLLAHAFPNHGNRSDTSSDLFDRCYLVSAQ